MQKTIIIAEAGVNHCGRVNEAKELAIAASSTGADAVKFQLFTERSRPKVRQWILQPDEWREVVKAATIPVFWSVFDFEGVDQAKDLGAILIKLSIVERRNSRLIAKINESGFDYKFVSVDLQGQYNSDELSDWEKLYCPNKGWSGIYPTHQKDIEWELFQKAAQETGMGYSCHAPTHDFRDCVLAAAFGAKVIERHFMINRECPDAKVSIEPAEFTTMVKLIRGLEDAKSAE